MRKKNSTLIFIYSAVLLAMALSLFGLYRTFMPLGEGQVGVLDGDRIAAELPAIIQLKKDLNYHLQRQQKKFSKLEDLLRKENQELIQIQQSWSAQSSQLSRMQLEAKQKQFSLKVENLQKEAEQTQKKLNAWYDSSLKLIKDKMNSSIRKIAHKKRLSMVLYSHQVAYHQPSLDITDDLFKDLENFQYSPLNSEL